MKKLQLPALSNAKKLKRNELKNVFGGDFGSGSESECSCTFDCGSGSIARVDSCTECLTFNGKGVACYNSNTKTIHVQTFP